MSNNTSPPGGGRTIGDYAEPLLTAAATFAAAFGATYFLTNDQQRGGFTPLIVASAASLAQIGTQTLVAPAVTNTFQLQNKSITPPQVVDQGSPQFNNNTAGARYIPNPQSPLYAHPSVYQQYPPNQQLYYPYYPEDFGRRHHKKKRKHRKR